MGGRDQSARLISNLTFSPAFRPLSSELVNKIVAPVESITVLWGVWRQKRECATIVVQCILLIVRRIGNYGSDKEEEVG